MSELLTTDGDHDWPHFLKAHNTKMMYMSDEKNVQLNSMVILFLFWILTDNKK